jgi:probable phosphoglycerate mutase
MPRSAQAIEIAESRSPTNLARVVSLAQSWPAYLWLVRHGESAGNVSRDVAERDGHHLIDIAGRDLDVPLSELGERQSRALGRWFGGMAPRDQPSVVLCSPYVRARSTADWVISEGGLKGRKLDYVVDERLREKEFGSLNRFTRIGITDKFPEEAARRSELGKFYYRPPAGESWCDVILRLRSVLDHIQLRYSGERVLIVAHQVIVLCFRYLLEELDEERILSIDRERDVANCSVTSFEAAEDSHGRTKLLLRGYNFVAPLEAAGEQVTRDADAGSAAKS